MLKLSGGASKSGRANSTIPAHVTRLSLSWLNGQFKAIAVSRGAVDGTWERPGQAEDLAEFPALLREAVAQTGYKGTAVSLVLAHPRLAQQLSDAPPATGAALDRFVLRQAQQQKTFEGEAAYAYQFTLGAKGTPGLLLHLFPKALLDQLVDGASQAGLHLVGVHPPTAVLEGQMRQLPLEKDEVAVLCADTGGTITVLVGRGDGQIYLARTLSGGWNQNLGRFAVDLNRTLLFINQQFGVTVTSVWLFGAGAQERLAEVQPGLQVPVKVSPVGAADYHWATEVLKLPSDETANLISREIKEAPRRRFLARFAVVTVGVVVVACAGATMRLYRVTADTQREVTRLRQEAAGLQSRHQDLQKLDKELLGKQELVKVLGDGRPAPLAGWFLGYLSEVVPKDLVVTNLHVKRDKSLWQFRISGLVQASGTNSPSETVFTNAVTELERRLANGPFHARLDKGPPPERDKTSQPVLPRTSLAEFVSQIGSAPSSRVSLRTFQIQGVMR